MLATVVSAAFADYFFIEPIGQFAITNSADLISLVLFFVSGALISYLAEMTYRAQARVHKAEERSRLAFEREKAAVNFLQSESKYRELVQNANTAIVRSDSHGRITFFNEFAQKFFGYREDEIVGRTWLETIIPKTESSGRNLVAMVQEILRHPEQFESNENENIKRSGERVWVAWKNKAIQDDKGDFVGLLSIGTDITARKMAEDELRRIPSKLISVQEEERKRLASELHDTIGQTLSAVKFRVEMALNLRDAGDYNAALNHLEQFVPILQRSIEETRNIYMGLRPPMLDDVGLLATLEWLRQECMRLYPERHIELGTGVAEEGIPQNLKVSIFRIAQEALNNIAKHSKAEWVDVSLSKNGCGIELVVSDDGVGMDLDLILQTSTARSLGLTSMRERTELTGGSFSIESTPGEGTTIRACWPT